MAIFFLISGYAMTGLLESRFSGRGGAKLFYLERFVRLAPQYYLWLGLASIVTVGLSWYPVNMTGFVPYGLVSYLTIIPLGLQGYFGAVQTWIMSQASTLGVEITFYILSPWLLRGRWRAVIVGLACLIIYDATERGALTPALYTYYTSPGPLPLFLMGSLLFKKDWISLSILSSAMAVLLCFNLHQPFNSELLIGIALGMPAVALCARIPSRAWDAALGNASYGCYLGHGAVSIVLMHVLGRPVDGFSPGVRVVTVVLGCLAGYASYLLVERPSVPFRRRLRSPSAGVDDEPPAAGATPRDNPKRLPV